MLYFMVLYSIRNIMSDGSKRMGRTIKENNLNELLIENELTREELIDLGIMIGTDFHPGIKGGPKTGMKLIKKFGNIEICDEKRLKLKILI